ncbi:MAG: hypothetical protein JSU72_15760 [Deltaproteobacteria bacterium]|nr:MAG: hypothetical protein JSU72_15760 [Deltaproteobacteria bacterium]
MGWQFLTRISKSIGRACGGAILALLLAAPIQADEVREFTIGMDYRNQPEWQKLTGYEYAIVSPRADHARAAHAVDSLIAHGTDIIYWIQPFLCYYMGNPVTGWDYDDALLEVVRKHDAILKDPGGFAPTVEGDDISGCYVLDFTNRDFVREYAAVVTAAGEKSKGVLFDYGCIDLAWEPNLKTITAEQWREWGSGYYLVHDEIRRIRPDWFQICQCNRWGGWLSGTCDGLLFEKVGWSLNPYMHVWKTINAEGTHSVIMQQINYPKGRRLTAGMALLTDSYFNYRDINIHVWHNIKAPEYFELMTGDFYGRPYWERAPGVFMRIGTHGRVLVNLSQEPYKYGSRTIPAMDAVVIQHRDPETGRFMKWIDNQ